MDAALWLASFNGDASTVEELLSQGERVDSNVLGFTPLLVAAQRGHAEVCKLLLETGKANVKETNPNGNTPLLLAANGGHTELCELQRQQPKSYPHHFTFAASAKSLH